MPEQPTREFGRADLLDQTLGLDDATGSRLASIIVLAANIEFHLERAIWALNGIDPKGVRPETDARPVSKLIEMLEESASSTTQDTVRTLLETWCRSARSAFVIRNNIAHGVAFRVDTMLVFSRNPQWQGEIRKRDFGDLWCEPYVLDLIRESLATLLRIVVAIAQRQGPLIEIASPLALRAVGQARSILGEFADQFYNPGFEKY